MNERKSKNAVHLLMIGIIILISFNFTHSELNSSTSLFQSKARILNMTPFISTSLDSWMQIQPTTSVLQNKSTKVSGNRNKLASQTAMKMSPMIVAPVAAESNPAFQTQLQASIDSMKVLKSNCSTDFFLKLANRLATDKEVNPRSRCEAFFYQGYDLSLKTLKSMVNLGFSRRVIRNELMALVTENKGSKNTFLAISTKETPIDNSLDKECFAEGVAQGFELNYEGIKNNKEVFILTKIHNILDSLLKVHDKLKHDAMKCGDTNETETEKVFARFVYDEVAEPKVLKVFVDPIVLKSKNLKKWKALVIAKLMSFIEDVREIKAKTFNHLTIQNNDVLKDEIDNKKNFEKEILKESNIFMANVNMKLDSKIKEAPEYVMNKFEAVANTLARETNEKAKKLSKEIYDTFDDHKARINSIYTTTVDKIAQELNELFWEKTGEPIRQKNPKETEKQYFASIKKELEERFEDLKAVVNMHPNWDLVGKDDEKLKKAYKELVNDTKKNQGQLKELWKENTPVLKNLWFQAQKEETDALRNKIMMDDGTKCEDPIREMLHDLYKDFIAIELSPKNFKKAILSNYSPTDGVTKPSDEEVNKTAQTIMETGRDVKARIAQEVYWKLKGSMSSFPKFDQQWQITAKEQEEQWAGKMHDKRLQLLRAGIPLKDALKAMDEYSDALENMKKEDYELSLNAIKDWLTELELVKERVVNQYVQIATRLNNNLWDMIEQLKKNTPLSDMEKKLDDYAYKLDLATMLPDESADESTDGSKNAPIAYIPELNEKNLHKTNDDIIKRENTINTEHVTAYVTAEKNAEEKLNDLVSKVEDENEKEDMGLIHKFDEMQCLQSSDGKPNLDWTDVRKTPVDIHDEYSRFIWNENTEKTSLAKLVDLFDDENDLNTDDSAKLDKVGKEFYEDWTEYVRDVKSDEYAKVIKVFLDNEKKGADLKIALEKLKVEKNAEWATDKTKLEQEWLARNDLPESKNLLAKMLVAQEAKVTEMISNLDKEYENFLKQQNKFVNEVRREFTSIADELNRSWPTAVITAIAKAPTGDKSGSVKDKIESLESHLLQEIVREIEKLMKDKKLAVENISPVITPKYSKTPITKPVAGADEETFVPDLGTFINSTKKDYKDDYTQIIVLLQTQLSLIRDKVPPLREMADCPVPSVKHLLYPLKLAYIGFINDEITEDRMKFEIKEVINNPKLDRSAVVTKFEEIHESWIESNRDKKSDLRKQAEKLLLNNPIILDFFKKWDARKNKSVAIYDSNDVKRALAVKNDKNKAVDQNKKPFSKTAEEFDEALQQHIIGSFRDKLVELEKTIWKEFKLVATIINKHYLNYLAQRVKEIKLTTNTNTITSTIFDEVDKIQVSLKSWFLDSSPIIKHDDWAIQLSAVANKIIDNKDAILQEQNRLWTYLDAREEFYGNTTMDEFMINGKCNITGLLDHMNTEKTTSK